MLGLLGSASLLGLSRCGAEAGEEPAGTDPLACVVRPQQTEGPYYGHVAMRLIALLVLGYVTRRILHGRATMEQVIFGIKHHWGILESELIEPEALSCELSLERA